MNFRHMPELGWRYAIPAVLALMLSASALLYRRVPQVRLALTRRARPLSRRRRACPAAVPSPADRACAQVARHDRLLFELVPALP
jgi:hypothetical protein